MPVFVPLDRVRTHRNTDKRGTFRWHHDYRLPEHLDDTLWLRKVNSIGERRQLLNLIT